MPIAAPKAEPEDRPNVYGLTKGFLSIPCITAPHPAKAAPIITAVITLGNLICNITVLSNPVAFFIPPLNIVDNIT